MGQCMDCGDWVVVTFIFSFAAAGFAYCLLHPSEATFLGWLGLAGVLTGTFHWLRVKDQKTADAPGRDA